MHGEAQLGLVSLPCPVLPAAAPAATGWLVSASQPPAAAAMAVTCRRARGCSQFWRSSHPPQRGVLLLGTRPLVHAGFMAAWAGHGLDAQVLQRVREVLEGRRHAAMSSCVCTVARCCGGRHDGAEEAELASAASAAAAVEMTGYGEGGGVEGEEEENEGEEEEAEGWLSAEDEAAAARAVAAAAAAAGAAAAARGSEGEAASPSHYMPAGDSDSTPPEAPSGGHGVAPPPAPKAAPAAGWPGVEQPPPDGGCSPGGDSPGGSSNGGSDGGSPSSRRRQQQQPFRLLVTGHSLGGAVATLCALDLARHLPLWGFTTVVAPSSPAGCSAAVVAAPSGAPAASAAAAGSGSCSAQPEPGGPSSAADTAAYGGGKAAEPRPQRRPVAVSCYSFGGPRTGNHALAREYWRAVPDSWAVINDQDLGGSCCCWTRCCRGTRCRQQLPLVLPGAATGAAALFIPRTPHTHTHTLSLSLSLSLSLCSGQVSQVSGLLQALRPRGHCGRPRRPDSQPQ